MHSPYVYIVHVYTTYSRNRL